MAGIEARHLALEAARGARGEAEAARGEEAGQVAAAEGERLLPGQRLGIEAALVAGHPELEAGQQAPGGDGGLREEVIEAAPAHGKGVARGAVRVARRVAGTVAAAALAGCALLGPGPLPEAMLAELVARAESARGLRFPVPIEAERLAPRRVRAVLAAELDVAASGEDFARAEALEQGLGLLPQGTSLREALLDFQADAVAGFYTPLRRRLYVVYDGSLRGGLPQPVATVFVHELVHALQGAHSPLLDVLIGLEDHDDLAFALGALLEGDALWAAFRDQELVTGVPPLAAEALAADTDLDSAAGPGAAAPRLLRESFLLQYPLGYAISEVLAERGGSAALDAALRDPPLSSEELLHPELYLEGPRRPIAWWRFEPEELGLAGCRALASNSFGELGLRIWAREHGASEVRAASAAAGWDGDRAAVFGCAEGTRVAWLVQFDTPVDAAELEGLALASAPAGLVAERRGQRVLLSRGLSAEARAALLAAPERRFPDLAGYLAARPEVLARAAELRARVRPRAGR
jgi:hypothetical protein